MTQISAAAVQASARKAEAPTRQGLSPYRQCPSATPALCAFAEPAEIVQTGVVGPFDECRVYRCARCGHGVSRPALPDAGILYQQRESQDYQQTDGPLATFIKTIAFRRQARQ